MIICWSKALILGLSNILSNILKAAVELANTDFELSWTKFNQMGHIWGKCFIGLSMDSTFSFSTFVAFLGIIWLQMLILGKATWWGCKPTYFSAKRSENSILVIIDSGASELNELWWYSRTPIFEFVDFGSFFIFHVSQDVYLIP